MHSSLDSTKIDVIFAEDDPVFQEITIGRLIKAGLTSERIHVVEDGLSAFECWQKLQAGGDREVALPIIAILDMRMPKMTGDECANRMRQFKAEHSVCRLTFTVLCSADVTQVSDRSSEEPNSSLFHMMFPKPFGTKEVELCLSVLERWLAQQVVGTPDIDTAAAADIGAPAKSKPEASGGYPATGDFKAVDVVIADREAVCRMAIAMQLGRLGLEEDCISEADSVDEASGIVADAQILDPPRPLVVLLSEPDWVTKIIAASTEKRRPFLVYTSVNSLSASNKPFFQASLTRNFEPKHLQEILEMAQTCWRE